MVFTWKRPENVPFPMVWLKFKAKDSDNDNEVNYHVQDLPEDRYNDAIQYMTDNFLREEPICSSTELYKEEDSVEEIQGLWKLLLAQKIVLVCFKENSDEIIGINMVGVTTLEEKNEVYEPKSKKWAYCYGAVDYVISQCDVMKQYNVDKYMTAFGLSVAPKYRGRGIAAQILKARVPLAKAVGLQLTTTVFTAIASQIPAERVNFELNSEVTYKDLTAKGYHFPGVQSKSMKLMSLKID